MEVGGKVCPEGLWTGEEGGVNQRKIVWGNGGRDLGLHTCNGNPLEKTCLGGGLGLPPNLRVKHIQ